MLGKFVFANLPSTLQASLSHVLHFSRMFAARRCTTVTLDARGLIGRNTGMIVRLGVRERPRYSTYKMKEPGDKQVEEKKKLTKLFDGINSAYIHLIHSL